MAAAATDWLSLADAKADMRLATDEDDALIEAFIDSAVSFVSVRCDLPLLDGMRRATVPIPVARREPVTVRSGGFNDVVKISYWLPDQDVSEAPTGEVKAGRVEDAGHRFIRIWPGEDWPGATLADYPFAVVEFSEGLNAANPKFAGIRQALKLLVAKYHRGDLVMAEGSAVDALLAPYRSLV